MALLALYWSIMIVCYLLASRLRRHAPRFRFVYRLLDLSISVLVLLMGLRMGSNREVTDSLATIGVQALGITVLTAAGSMLGAFAVRRLFRIDRCAHPRGMAQSADRTQDAPDAAAQAAGLKTSLHILAMVALGMLLGYLALPRVCDVAAFQAASGDWMTVALCVMVGLIGFTMGLENKLVTIVQSASVAVLLVPLAMVAGTLLAGAVYSLISPLTLQEGLAVSAGFGWYTFAPSVITGAGHAVAGAVSFLHNVLRETTGIVLMPLVASRLGYIEAVTLPGTAAMDIGVTIAEKSCNAETLPYSFACGTASSLFCALLVPLIMGA